MAAAAYPSQDSAKRQLHGYHRMARMMGKSDELAIFRKFNDVNMLSLLSLQAEILELRDDFYIICEGDEELGRDFSTSMLHLLQEKNDSGKNQYQALELIRDKIQQYIAQLSELHQPRDDYLASLRDWLKDRKGGYSKGIFKTKEAFIWEKKDFRGENTEHDLITVARPRGERDLFTKYVICPLVGLFHRIWGRRNLNKRYVIDEESGYVEYSEEKIDRAGTIISTIVASLLPAAAMSALFFINSLQERIHAMLGITAVFAILLAVMSNAKRIEIFTATATFAAVEAVFIGSTSVYFGGHTT
ncbi:hypothetical protein CC80DRAFT_481821 [Byssothecium circinans]|uniref:DUF6594 domain-containing protein n=1 Tax=Byssothecium circinans TaxID=147558 RepID=A0A6A5TER6_9PLEO|nr:hypothetical protein CC80DRAFT_481821 [Byssothecium circinans]